MPAILTPQRVSGGVIFAGEMAEYSLGHGASEQTRLQKQAEYLRGITESIWRDAGIGSGMRVLDVGCGVGDSTFLAADLAGYAVGLDRSEEAIATARQRAEADGRTNVRFVQAEIGDPVPDEAPFDAIVGRYILVHQRDIAATLRSLHPLLLPGGLIVFHEVELDLRLTSVPVSELGRQVYQWLRQAFQVAGVQMQAVSQMPRFVYESGFGWPQTRIHPLVESGGNGFAPGYVVETLRSIAPLLESAGVVTVAELGLDTLEARLRESCANGATSLAQVNAGVWARRP